ncbi:hypothetical protein [Fischerella sp. PCC 9605]|uniref:hypothetical protein n=1 Tax=Fischerella sp. PCC 9605 TaxID=1173024 RepID=UPI000479A724|nr:hypothetical protein [Fischerella sp. PCC 9605]
MSLGIIEAYSGGFLEIIPEGEGSDYWLIVAIHINGEVLRPSPRLYRNKKQALAKAKKIYDWIANRDRQIYDRVCWCEELGITLWHESKNYF